MGKRSTFERRERDFYPTPFKAVEPLIPFLDKDFYVEPCAGDGSLIRHLSMIECIFACDIEPQAENISKINAMSLTLTPDMYITNPPWQRDILHPLIEHLSNLAPTWLLFDADWMHTKQAKPFIPRLQKIVSVGRIKWIPDSKMTGKDNCCWYLFDKNNNKQTEFYA